MFGLTDLLLTDWSLNDIILIISVLYYFLTIHLPPCLPFIDDIRIVGYLVFGAVC